MNYMRQEWFSQYQHILEKFPSIQKSFSPRLPFKDTDLLFPIVRRDGEQCE